MPPIYRGHFGKPQAERLLWRAGFGPRPGEAERLAKLGLEGAVHALMRPGRDRLKGPRPHDDRGHKLSPYDRWGHDQLWWLDRMVRTTKPLHERMTLVWHDWFATSRDGVGPAKLMLRQNQLFRRLGLSSFPGLLMEVTRDPAMLLWLSGVDNEKGSPNENYARELMELFTLGADRGAYSERDVREQARALTGFRYTWSNSLGPVRFRFDPKRHDTGTKRIFGKRGHFDWRDSCHLCVHHRLHPSFFVTKLWSYFVPVPPSGGTKRSLERLYVKSGYEVGPVVAAILRHPALYTGPRMVKSPALYLAGMLRGLERGIDTEAWTWLMELAGQQLFYPPNVAGWDDSRWLDTATFRARWEIAGYAIRPRVLKQSAKHVPDKADKLVDRARHVLGGPTLTGKTEATLTRFATHALGDAERSLEEGAVPAADRERPAAAARHRPRPADLMSRSCHHCDEFTRASLLRRGAAEAGRGLPAIEPGMPAPAGTGLDRRSFVSGALGLALSVYGLGKLRPVRGRDRAGGLEPRPAGARVGLPARRRRLALGALPRARPELPQAAPDARASGLGRTGVRRGQPAALAPDAAAAGDAARRGQGLGHAGDRLHPSRPVALHLAPLLGGRRDRRAPRKRLDGPLPRPPRRERQPAPGPLARLPAPPALASTKVPVASLAAPDQYSSGRRASGARSRTGCSTRWAARCAPGRPVPEPGGAATKQSDRLRRQLAPFARTATTASAARLPTRTGDDSFPRQLAGLAAMLAADLPLHCVALRRPANTTRTPTSRRRSPTGSTSPRDSLLAFQRDLEARGLADRVLTQVWSEFGRRGEENGSDGTDHGAAGTAFLIGARARGQMVGEFPGLANGLDNDGNLKPTSDFRGVYCSLLEQWFGADAAAVIPGARAFSRPALVA